MLWRHAERKIVWYRCESSLYSTDDPPREVVALSLQSVRSCKQISHILCQLTDLLLRLGDVLPHPPLPLLGFLGGFLCRCMSAFRPTNRDHVCGHPATWTGREVVGDGSLPSAMSRRAAAF